MRYTTMMSEWGFLQRSFDWNETVRRGIAPLRDEYVTEDAFSMVDPMLRERAARKLEARGMRAAIVVRIFFMEASFEDKTNYVLGLENDYRGFPQRVRSSLLFHTLASTAQEPGEWLSRDDLLTEQARHPRATGQHVWRVAIRSL